VAPLPRPKIAGVTVTLPGVGVTVLTSDGERLAGWHVPPPRGRDAYGVGVLVAPGFTGSLGRPDVQAVARGLAARAGVLLLTPRGHPGSTGVSTLGDREALDVDGGVAALRALGYARVVTCGWSMGGSAVVRHAGLAGSRVHGALLAHPPDAVVAVSTTSRWWATETRSMRRLHWLVETMPGRLVSRRLGVRVDRAGWEPADLPVPPGEAARRVRVPMLIVHGDADAYFPVDHPHALVAAAGEGAELWLLPGFGHAENAAARDPAVLERISAHLPVLLAAAAAAAAPPLAPVPAPVTA